MLKTDLTVVTATRKNAQILIKIGRLLRYLAKNGRKRRLDADYIGKQIGHWGYILLVNNQ